MVERRRGKRRKRGVVLATMREGDTEQQARFRASRFFHSMEEWYFLTREGTVEGPYEDRAHAERMLESYLGRMKRQGD